LTEVLGRRHSSLAALLEPVYREVGRTKRIMARRGMLTELRHRMFLALLVNLPGRSSVNEVMRQLFPGEDPDALTLTLVEELASPEYRGISGLRMGPDDLDSLRLRLSTSVADDPLGVISDQWRPPSLIDRLVV
jgi:hypothetical protein